jgi:hypothetical protein
MFRDNILLSGGSPAGKLPPFQLTLDEQFPIRLRDHLQRLRLILPVISVTVMALRRQNAELDEDIASVLHQHACDPLDVEIDKIEALIESLAAARRSQEVTP